MDKLEQTLTSIAKLDVNTLMQPIYKQDLVQKFIIDLNTDNQLREGLNAEGDILGFYRSFSYAVTKERISGHKAPFGQVDLYVSGRFYKTFRIKVLKSGFEIIADTDIYGQDFDEIYGNVKGLTKDSKELLGVYLLEFIRTAIIKAILQ